MILVLCKRTEEQLISPMQEEFRFEAGNSTLAGVGQAGGLSHCRFNVFVDTYGQFRVPTDFPKKM
ncbi:hypothetical protein [Microcoleus sp. S13_C5]|uniref:hypothetical protein n=1 Tax=Microcoleus sp. S13_C5 TaxID=3055411 RepID=UPI002FD54BED